MFCEDSLLTLPYATDGFRKPLADYAVSCSQKGNRQSTVDLKMRSCISLCIFAERCGCTEPRQLTAPAVSRFCLQACSQDRWRFVREFLRLLHEGGYTEKDYSYVVPKAVCLQPGRNSENRVGGRYFHCHRQKGYLYPVSSFAAGNAGGGYR